jgi:hypothetical protein
MPTEISERFQLAYPAYERKMSTFSRIRAKEVPDMGADDLFNEIAEVLWRVCLAYDPNKGATFNTVFWQAAGNHLKDLKKAAFRHKRVIHSMTTSLDVDAVRYAVEELTLEDSAEDVAISLANVQQRFLEESRRVSQERRIKSA